MAKFLSARPGRGATTLLTRKFQTGGVSIRTPRAGRDNAVSGANSGGLSFYPHAPGGARHSDRGHAVISNLFLSARPGRGATSASPKSSYHAAVSIRTPRAGRDLP
ncbi:MAG: hypothetical protein XD36_1911 [Halomonas sp. 54_146]|nr:MAG: hypothetical protein XD36_1911 [Halomonas sp. 54_146]